MWTFEPGKGPVWGHFKGILPRWQLTGQSPEQLRLLSHRRGRQTPRMWEVGVTTSWGALSGGKSPHPPPSGMQRWSLEGS